MLWTLGKAVSMHRMHCLRGHYWVSSDYSVNSASLCPRVGAGWGAGCPGVTVSRGDWPPLADTELANIGGLGCCPLLPLLGRAPPAPGQPQHPSLSQHTEV